MPGFFDSLGPATLRMIGAPPFFLHTFASLSESQASELGTRCARRVRYPKGREPPQGADTPQVRPCQRRSVRRRLSSLSTFLVFPKTYILYQNGLFESRWNNAWKSFVRKFERTILTLRKRENGLARK